MKIRLRGARQECRAVVPAVREPACWSQSWERPCPGLLAAVRAEIREWLAGHGLSAVADDVTLMASELLTNAFLHGALPVEARLTATGLASGREVTCEVTDASPKRPVFGGFAPDEEHGRGLVVVTRLASVFGIRPHPNGKTVWFTITVPTAALTPGWN